ncbi:hypothetical protein HGRIS_011007 [Hohenbuehelia grisea]|uniref:Uncharacterized protein n=1 Tax=Hohenbuehelia grisea TaxID=104357 RepID=A0ABR3IYS7_9AGAR
MPGYTQTARKSTGGRPPKRRLADLESESQPSASSRGITRPPRSKAQVKSVKKLKSGASETVRAQPDATMGFPAQQTTKPGDRPMGDNHQVEQDKATGEPATGGSGGLKEGILIPRRSTGGTTAHKCLRQTARKSTGGRTPRRRDEMA